MVGRMVAQKEQNLAACSVEKKAVQLVAKLDLTLVVN